MGKILQVSVSDGLVAQLDSLRLRRFDQPCRPEFVRDILIRALSSMQREFDQRDALAKRAEITAARADRIGRLAKRGKKRAIRLGIDDPPENPIDAES